MEQEIVVTTYIQTAHIGPCLRITLAAAMLSCSM